MLRTIKKTPILFRKNSSGIKRIIALIIIGLCSLAAMAQREKNYIYLFDCTGSMKTNGLWQTAQTALDNNIALRASIPGSHFAVIPFGDNAYQTFSFGNSEYSSKKKEISGAFSKYIQQAKFTNISDVLKSGFSQINTNKENEIYLFTDGKPNGGDTPENVAKTINEWCAGHRNSKLFYVALTKDVVNPVIKRAIDACPDASIVQCEDGVIPVIADISTDIYTNIEELGNEIDVAFSIPGSYRLTSTCDDQLFDFDIIGNNASNGKIKIKIAPKSNLSINDLHQKLQGNDYEFQSTIQCVDRRFLIANPIVTIHISDDVPSKLTIAQGVDELQSEGVKWYDSFLWSRAAPDQKVVWDLAPTFKNELQNSQLLLEFQAGEGQPSDFKAWYNGEPISNGATIAITPHKPALLEVMFNHDATTGKRYFSLTPTNILNLDFINEQPSENYTGTSLRTCYNIGWNPLKTILFWLVIILLAALAIWLIVLKRIFFPPIKMGKITITGPASYYASKKIKGARKVMLTSKRKSQNIFSRIFTGEIKFIKADHFTPDITISAAGGKKKVKMRAEMKASNPWELYPSSIFGQYEKGTLTNRDSKEKSEVEFS